MVVPGISPVAHAVRVDTPVTWQQRVDAALKVDGGVGDALGFGQAPGAVGWGEMDVGAAFVGCVYFEVGLEDFPQVLQVDNPSMLFVEVEDWRDQFNAD
jgi:hypothetical protein